MSCLRLLKSACPSWNWRICSTPVPWLLREPMGVTNRLSEVFLEYFSTHPRSNFAGLTPDHVAIAWQFPNISCLDEDFGCFLEPWSTGSNLHTLLIAGEDESPFEISTLCFVSCSLCYVLPNRRVCPFVLFAPGIIRAPFFVFVSHNPQWILGFYLDVSLTRP